MTQDLEIEQDGKVIPLLDGDLKISWYEDWVIYGHLLRNGHWLLMQIRGDKSHVPSDIATRVFPDGWEFLGTKGEGMWEKHYYYRGK